MQGWPRDCLNAGVAAGQCTVHRTSKLWTHDATFSIAWSRIAGVTVVPLAWITIWADVDFLSACWLRAKTRQRVTGAGHTWRGPAGASGRRRGRPRSSRLPLPHQTCERVESATRDALCRGLSAGKERGLPATGTGRARSPAGPAGPAICKDRRTSSAGEPTSLAAGGPSVRKSPTPNPGLLGAPRPPIEIHGRIAEQSRVRTEESCHRNERRGARRPPLLPPRQGQLTRDPGTRIDDDAARTTRKLQLELRWGSRNASPAPSHPRLPEERRHGCGCSVCD